LRGGYAVRFDFSNDALKVIDKLDTNTAGRIFKGIMGLPDKGDIKPLEGEHTGRFRLRVGSWRILYVIDSNSVMIDYILPRGKAYK
jgi:mRNA-degrading endonuclease RelE of RelBE toxin-antitoxin system